MTTPAETRSATASPRQIAIASGLALIVAAFVLVAAVLPAEFGIDPLGTGRRLGLTDLFRTSAEPSPPPVPKTGNTAPPRVYKVESTEFTLGASQGFEYKYRIDKGGGMVYAWKATGRVKYEFHGEPDDHALKVTSYEKQEDDHASGSFVAPFAGIHGWYWENPSERDLTITLTTAGFYSEADEMRPRYDAVKHKDFIEHIPHELSTPARFDATPSSR